jgi:hypothetical protein
MANFRKRYISQPLLLLSIHEISSLNIRNVIKEQKSQVNYARMKENIERVHFPLPRIAQHEEPKGSIYTPSSVSLHLLSLEAGVPGLILLMKPACPQTVHFQHHITQLAASC